MLLFICSSCEQDDVKPEITVDLPVDDIVFYKGDTLFYSATVSDDDELSTVEIDIELGDIINKSVQEITGVTKQIAGFYLTDGENDGTMSITIVVEDEAGNRTSVTRSYSYIAIAPAKLDMNIKLQYDGQPLVMFEDYQYPDGRAINFTRFSIYTTDVKLNDQLIDEVAFHNLTNNNVTIEGAAKGLMVDVGSVPPGNYSKLSFGVGLPEHLNSKQPSEFATGHPLARAAEHWFSWGSYIFTKIEGNLDSNSDGIKNLPLSLHVGADEAYRNIELDRPLIMRSGETTEVDVIIDVKDILQNGDDIFDIDADPQIHSLDQMSAILELTNNIEKAIK